MKISSATFRRVRIGLISAALAVAFAGCGGQWHLQRGAAALENQNFDAAVAHLEKAVRALPGNAEALNFYAAALIGKGNPEAAQEQLQACLKLAPNYPSARFHLGVVEFERGKYAEAVGTLKVFIESAPKGAPLAEAYALLADSYLRLGKLSEATRAYNQLVRVGGERADVCNKLGAFQFRLNQHHAAEEWFKASVRQNPRYAPANLNLALLYHFYLPNKPAARLYYKKFIDLTPDNPQHEQAKSLLSELDKELNQTRSVTATANPTTAGTALPTDSKHILNEKVESSSQESEVSLFNLGTSLYSHGQKKEAITEFEKVIRMNPDHALAHAYLGRLYGETTGKLSEARAHYRRFLELEPNDPQAPAIRAWLAQTAH